MTDKGMSASPLEALKGGFRRACVRRLVGDEQGAISVLKDEIPKLVVSWAKTSNLDADEKKVKLKEMFDDESARADELATAFDLFAGRFERRVADLVTKEIKKACQRVEKVADALEVFKIIFRKSQSMMERQVMSDILKISQRRESINLPFGLKTRLNLRSIKLKSMRRKLKLKKLFLLRIRILWMRNWKNWMNLLAWGSNLTRLRR